MVESITSSSVVNKLKLKTPAEVAETMKRLYKQPYEIVVGKEELK